MEVISGETVHQSCLNAMLKGGIELTRCAEMTHGTLSRMFNITQTYQAQEGTTNILGVMTLDTQ